ncbi:hypothetical protein HMPREF3034_01057 [Prevotella sp. DNF00663]|uniref:DUF4377 domain-containing protein n=1 Tax=Prevotella sp. DNF00663 TaxID=1384078 RepID=UPI000794C176|nr:hypothetical protein HMPREF3034_01057 [Prevotella sp. DNF00663]
MASQCTFYCEGESNLFFCEYIVKYEGQQSWTTTQYIENFEYEPGYEYRLDVSQSKDGTFAVKRVLSKEKKESENMGTYRKYDFSWPKLLDCNTLYDKWYKK